jgi:ribosomal protein S18 acetylase RimI-like enzyme
MADAAFPPARSTQLDGWVLRADDGHHRRNRSVWARAGDVDGLGARIDRVEEWYAGQDLPARFQITPASSPPGLEDALAERGYALDGPSFAWTGELATLGAPQGPVAIAERPDPDWLEVSGADPAVLERVTVPCAYVRTEAAAARGVLDGDWLGIYEVATLPSARRRGAASAIVAALAAWGLERGARRAYLLVLEDNEPANALYARLGFSRAYAYRYRVRELSSRGSRTGRPEPGPPPRPS